MMNRSSRVLLPTVFAILLGWPATAHASRFDFSGGGSDGVIIWDGNNDVSTMQNNCNAVQPSPCLTSNYVLGSTLTFLLTGGVGSTLTFSSLSLVLTVPAVDLPASCPATIVCGQLGSFGLAGQLAASNIDLGNFDSTNTSASVIFLPAVLPAGGIVQAGNSFSLTQASLTFLSTHAPSTAVPWVIGFHLNFNQTTSDGIGVPFTLQVQQNGNVIPEPSTLLLLAGGLAALAAGRRKLKRT